MEKLKGLILFTKGNPRWKFPRACLNFYSSALGWLKRLNLVSKNREFNSLSNDTEFSLFCVLHIVPRPSGTSVSGKNSEKLEVSRGGGILGAYTVRTSFSTLLLQSGPSHYLAKTNIQPLLSINHVFKQSIPIQNRSYTIFSPTYHSNL